MDLINSKIRPKDFGKIDFDVHVYYNNEEVSRGQALQLRDLMKADFKQEDVFVGELIDFPIGPHPLPMWEANLRKESFLEMISWLMAHRGELVVLVHSLSGNHVWDHTAGAMFFGHVPPLNIEFLRGISKK